MSNCYTFPNSSSRRGHLATVGAKEICQSTCTRRRTVAVFKADEIQLTFLTANASSWHRSVFLSPDGTILTLALLSIFDTSYARGCLPDCGRGQHETLDLCTQRSACDTLHYNHNLTVDHGHVVDRGCFQGPISSCVGCAALALLVRCEQEETRPQLGLVSRDRRWTGPGQAARSAAS